MESQGDHRWSQRLVATAKLGDKRRNMRAASVALGLLQSPGASLASAARGNEAAKERFYRHARAEAVSADELVRSGCTATAEDVLEHSVGDVLLIGDMTTLGYTHSVARELGCTGQAENNAVRGWQVHSVLAVSASSGEVFGPVEQFWWTRHAESHGRGKLRKKRAYADKESYKWEASADSSYERLAAISDRLVFVTDRESDVYEYLVSLTGQGQRFVCRSAWNRCIDNDREYLFTKLESQPILGNLRLEIAQKGKRARRTTRLVMRTSKVELMPSKNTGIGQPRIAVNAVFLEETTPPDGVEPIRWVLLTSEPVDGFEDALKVAHYYARRWRIEEFHKVWKSEGLRVEHLRMTTPSNLRRVAVLQAFCAARLMRLRDALVPHPQTLTLEEHEENMSVEHDARDNFPCDQILTTSQWKILWMAAEKTAPPSEVPSRRWASTALAKLGSWTDTKRTGRPGHKAYFLGWQRLMERCELYDQLALLGHQASSEI
jgi:hypothetical protein